MPSSSSLARLLVLLVTFTSATARLLDAVPDDPHSFPKYRVTFLNGLPVLNETALHWLAHGLAGGEPEFLDHRPWARDRSPDLQRPHDSDSASTYDADRRKEIGEDERAIQPLSSLSPSASDDTLPSYRLEHMRMGPNGSFLCLVPPPLDPPPEPAEEELQEVTPIHSWSLLQPLTGKCLYHRQAWFTYSYCHNSHVRQFREKPHAHPHPPGGWEPEEDETWEGFTLGRAPPIPEPGTELTLAEESALAANLDIARGAGSRYLVQRWSDGTVCDHTGRKREIEIQFHCSMTTTDQILFVKETKTCVYVLVVQTPRLCSEPGFRSRLEQREEAFIRCREIVPTLEGVDPSLPESDLFVKAPKRVKPVLPPPPPQPASQGKGSGSSGSGSGAGNNANDMLRKALEALMGGSSGNGGGGKLGDSELTSGYLVQEINEDGELVVEFIGEDEFEQLEAEGEFQGEGEGLDGGRTFDALGHNAIADALRAAGYDVSGYRQPPKQKQKGSQNDGDEGEADGTADAAQPHPIPRDEL